MATLKVLLQEYASNRSCLTVQDRVYWCGALRVTLDQEQHAYDQTQACGAKCHGLRVFYKNQMRSASVAVEEIEGGLQNGETTALINSLLEAKEIAESKASLRFCIECKKETLHRYVAKQMRRADEGTDMFVVCNACHSETKVS